MPFLAIAALAAITYTFRIAGPLLQDRVTVPAAAQQLFASAAAVLLVALAATSALTTGHDFAGWARPAGVLGGRRPRRPPRALPHCGAVRRIGNGPAPARRNPLIPNGPVVSPRLAHGARLVRFALLAWRVTESPRHCRHRASPVQ